MPTDLGKTRSWWNNACSRDNRRRLLFFLLGFLLVAIIYQIERSRLPAAPEQAIRAASSAAKHPLPYNGQAKRLPVPPPQPAARPPPRRIDWWAEYKQRRKRLTQQVPKSLQGIQKPFRARDSSGASREQDGKTNAHISSQETMLASNRNRPFGKAESSHEDARSKSPKMIGKAVNDTVNEVPRPKQTPDVSTPSLVAQKPTSARPAAAAPGDAPVPEGRSRALTQVIQGQDSSSKPSRSPLSYLRHWRLRHFHGHSTSSDKFDCKRGCSGRGCCQEHHDEDIGAIAAPLFKDAHICQHDARDL